MGLKLELQGVKMSVPPKAPPPVPKPLVPSCYASYSQSLAQAQAQAAAEKAKQAQKDRAREAMSKLYYQGIAASVARQQHLAGGIGEGNGGGDSNIVSSPFASAASFIPTPSKPLPPLKPPPQQQQQQQQQQQVAGSGTNGSKSSLRFIRPYDYPSQPQQQQISSSPTSSGTQARQSSSRSPEKLRKAQRQKDTSSGQTQHERQQQQHPSTMDAPMRPEDALLLSSEVWSMAEEGRGPAGGLDPWSETGGDAVPLLLGSLPKVAATTAFRRMMAQQQQQQAIVLQQPERSSSPVVLPSQTQLLSPGRSASLSGRPSLSRGNRGVGFSSVLLRGGSKRGSVVTPLHAMYKHMHMCMLNILCSLRPCMLSTSMHAFYTYACFLHPCMLSTPMHAHNIIMSTVQLPP